MWLLETTSLELKEVVDSDSQNYAILSHTWSDEEVSFLEMQTGDEAGKRKAGLAKANGYDYGWVDTCCIDKRNSAELSEAINSMFRYYYDAGECLIYLSDVPHIEKDIENPFQRFLPLRDNRWFTRGWTLQELLAPRAEARRFFSAGWSEIDTSGGFLGQISDITGVNIELLKRRSLLSTFYIADRLSWAARRETTRKEDLAYCLMGLFDINMPVLYGEGSINAFRRLQEEIMRASFDQSIFAWIGPYKHSGLLAKSPNDFRTINYRSLVLWEVMDLEPFTMTNVGLFLPKAVIKVSQQHKITFKLEIKPSIHLAILQCNLLIEGDAEFTVLSLLSVPGASFNINGRWCKAYRRIQCDF